MIQPVKNSDEVILDARLTAEIAERSIAGQLEFWAQLGRAIEPLLEGSRALALRRAGAAVPLSDRLASIDSALGRRRVAVYLESRPFPHYDAIAGVPGLLVLRITLPETAQQACAIADIASLRESRVVCQTAMKG
jgi:hypothetical protein